MRVTVIGCSGSFPGPRSPASSYLVEAEGFRLLLDMVLTQLVPWYDPAEILAEADAFTGPRRLAEPGARYAV
jgi:hypothetical protein